MIRKLRAAGDGFALRSRDVTAAGFTRAQLARFVAEGLLEQVDRGLYRLVDAPITEYASLVDVAKRAPNAVICLLSALQFHGMTTELPSAVWIMVDTHRRPPKITTPRIEVVRASGDALAHGVVAKKLEGVKVQITSPAKTVADCFRYRKHVGLEIALEALRDYLRRRRRDPDGGGDGRGGGYGMGSGDGAGRGDGTGYGYGSADGSGRGDGFGPAALPVARRAIDALMAAARADNVVGIIRPYLEALV